MSEHPMQVGSTEQSPIKNFCVCPVLCVCVWGGGGGGGGGGPPGPSPGSATAQPRLSYTKVNVVLP